MIEGRSREKFFVGGQTFTLVGPGVAAGGWSVLVIQTIGGRKKCGIKMNQSFEIRFFEAPRYLGVNWNETESTKTWMNYNYTRFPRQFFGFCGSD